MNTHIQQEAYQEAKAITKKYGTSYYFATRFFPENMRYATYALYAFFRLPDEIVDNPAGDKTSEELTQELEDWHEKWRQAYDSQDTDSGILNITAETFKKFEIPYQYSEDFLKAMKQDISKERYQTYQELEEYMYGSAAVVGLMMAYVIGFSDKKALEYAEKLGYAMQLTNFLRDVREDYELRRRIYMPLDEMARYTLREEDIKQHTVDDRFIPFMKFQIERTRKLYEEADKGIKYLNPEGRFAVIMARTLYSAILGKIEEQNYDVYTKRARTAKREKIYLLGKQVLKHRL
jgi:phytoene synthase